MDELRETLAATPLSSLAAAEQDILSLEHNHTVADALRVRGCRKDVPAAGSPCASRLHGCRRQITQLI
jgi:hypothetical protein